MSRYDFINIISQGSHGTVHRAVDKKTGEIVAIKQKLPRFPSTSTFRDINVLKSLPFHPSLVEVKDVVGDGSSDVYIVMELLETDLGTYINAREHPFSITEVKNLMKQLLEGVKFLHDNSLMHRDLKPSNILMNTTGSRLKISDFGLSRPGGTLGSYTPGVGTVMYRAPELLLGADEYSSAIDMWSVGCVMAELLLKKVLFNGRCEIEQLCEIHRILGVSTNARSQNLLGRVFVEATGFRQAPMLTQLGLDLLKKLLAYDPSQRITAEDALHHGWFAEFDSYLYQ